MPTPSISSDTKLRPGKVRHGKVRHGWIIAPDHAGALNQCLGLSAHLGLKPKIKIVHTRQAGLIARLALGGPKILQHLALTKIIGLKPGTIWPKYIIACGNRSIGVALITKNLSGAKAIYLQNPYRHSNAFDLVIPPLQDGLSGHNIVLTDGTIHRINRQTVRQAAGQSWPFCQIKKPLAALLFAKANGMQKKDFEALAQRIANDVQLKQHHIVIAPSRRTKAWCLRALIGALAGQDISFEITQPTGTSNPYFALLHHASILMVSADSVSMLSEACTLGKPVYIVGLDQLPLGRIYFFNYHLIRHSHAKMIEDYDSQWRPKRLDGFKQALKAARAILNSV